MAQKISTVAGGGRRSRPSASRSGRSTIRDKPAPVPEPFSTETVGGAVDSIACRDRDVDGQHHGRVLPGPRAEPRAPVPAAGGSRASTTARRSTASSAGSSSRAGYLPTRREPLDERQQRYVRPLQPEFNATPHDRGILSMARGDDPASATTLVLHRPGAHAGARRQVHRVRPRRRGAGRVEKIEAVPVNGEAPVTRIDVDARDVVKSCMLKGTRDAVLHRMQPISIHGQLSYDLHYTFADEPDGQMRVARVGRRSAWRQACRTAIASRLDFIVGVVTAVQCGAGRRCGSVEHGIRPERRSDGSRVITRTEPRLRLRRRPASVRLCTLTPSSRTGRGRPRSARAARPRAARCASSSRVGGSLWLRVIVVKSL